MVTSLQRFRRSDGRLAPHKPLVLLLSIGRHVSTGDSLLAWRRDAGPLEELLNEYGSWGRSHVGDPFVRLDGSGLWTASSGDGAALTDPTPSRLTAVDARGELPLRFRCALDGKPGLLPAVVDALLDMTGCHEPGRLVRAVGFGGDV